MVLSLPASLATSPTSSAGRCLWSSRMSRGLRAFSAACPVLRGANVCSLGLGDSLVALPLLCVCGPGINLQHKTPLTRLGKMKAPTFGCRQGKGQFSPTGSRDSYGCSFLLEYCHASCNCYCTSPVVPVFPFDCRSGASVPV